MSSPTQTAAEIQAARHAFESALFDGCSASVTVPLGRALAELEEAADPALKARRLRTAAGDLDARVNDLLGEHAQDLLVVRVRRERQGADDAVAFSIERRAAASKAEAEDLAAQASALRTAANRLAPLAVAAE